MTWNIRTVNLDMLKDLRMNTLVYGDIGSGKTTLACTAQDHKAMAPVLLLSVEPSILTIAGRGDIDELQVDDIKTDVEDVLWGISQGDKQLTKYKTVILDSASELAARVLQESSQRNITKFKQDRGQDETQIEDYNLYTNRMKRIVRFMRDLPIHSILTAHPRFILPPGAKSDNIQPSKVLPDFTSKLATSIMGFVDHVWYLYPDDDDSRWILTRDRGPYQAKTRYEAFANALGERYANPQMPVLLDLLLQTVREGDKKQLKGA